MPLGIECNHFTLPSFFFSIFGPCKGGLSLENAQGTSVQALINRITHYDSRRLENFAKYEAVRLAEELVSLAKTTGHAKVASYDIIATTLKEKIHVSKEQFKAYFLALLYLYVHILPTPPPPSPRLGVTL